MTTIGHHQLLLTDAIAPTSLNELILSLGPSFYWRHAEASGAIMENDVSVVDGAYVGAPLLARPALYPGGPTCAYFGSSKRGEDSAALPTTVTALSLFCIVKFTVLTGFRGIISRDPSANRKWQWRTNGTAIEFVRIPGSTATVSSGSGVIGTTKAHALGLTVTGTACKFYVDGVLRATTSLGSTQNLGGASKFEIGYMAGGGGSSSSAEAYFSESAYFPSVLSDADMAALYAMSGL